VGNTIGIGIFVSPGRWAPYGLNALTAWLIHGLGCVFSPSFFAGLARAFRWTRGPYAYTLTRLRQGRRLHRTVVYWSLRGSTNAAIAIGVVGYLSIFVPALNSNPWLPPWWELSARVAVSS